MPHACSAIHVRRSSRCGCESLDEAARIDRPASPATASSCWSTTAAGSATQREIGALAPGLEPAATAPTLRAAHARRRERRGRAAPGEPAEMELWGEPVTGPLVEGPWAEAVSGAGRAAPAADARRRGVRCARPPRCRCCPAAVDRAGRRMPAERRPGRPPVPAHAADRRLRPHEEDEWVGGACRPATRCCTWSRLDPRCALTTRNPETGERDADTLRLDRPDPRAGRRRGLLRRVRRRRAAGHVRVGDTVEPLEQDGR